MIKTLTAVAVVLAASLSVAQAADPNANESFVAQIGNSNAATVGQVGGNNTQATFQVPLFHSSPPGSNNSNVAITAQTGISPTGSGWFYNPGVANASLTVQSGIGNESITGQQQGISGSDQTGLNTSATFQVGDNNLAETSQSVKSGLTNTSVTAQIGNGNVALITQHR